MRPTPNLYKMIIFMFYLHRCILTTAMQNVFIWDFLSPTFTAPRVVNKVIIQSPAVAQLVPAFVVVSCSVGSAYWVLIGGAVVKTHAACFMCTVCLADPER